MKRKIIGAAAAYLSGLFFALFFTDISGILMFSGIALVVIGAGIRRKFSVADFAMLAISFLAAFLVCTAYTKLTFDRITALDGTSGTFSGKITQYELYDGGYASYTVKCRINGDISAKILLFTSELDAGYGDMIAAEDCSFHVPENTYLFRTADYCRSRHIFIQAKNGDISVKNTGHGMLRNALRDFRERTIERFIRKLGSDCGGFLAGMVFGEKDCLDPDLRTAVYRSGIGHILAVSGLHVSMIAAAVMAVLKKMRVNKFLSFGLVNLLMLTLIVLANCPISAFRAALMLDIMYSARLFRQQNDPLNSLSVAALLICLADPYAILNSGFLLSLSGTFGIAVFGPYMAAKISRETWFGRACSGLITAVCTTLAIFPASVRLFDETSLISPLTNLLLVPLCSFAMLVGLIDMVTFGCLPILPAAGIPIRLVIAISDRLAALGGTYISNSGETLPSLLIMLSIVCILIFFVTGNRRKTAVCVASAFLICSSVHVYENIRHERQCIVAVLGKNTDAAAVISYNGHSQIIDLTGKDQTRGYVGKYVSVNGIRPERLILTKKEDSLLSAYYSALQPFQPEETMTSRDMGKYTVFQAEDCAFMYSEDVLIVKYGGTKVTLLPAGIDRNEGLSVYYGSPENISHTGEKAVYLGKCEAEYSGFNNFEITLSPNGRCEIRRLYG